MMVTSWVHVKERLPFPVPSDRRLPVIPTQASGYLPRRLFCLLNDFRTYIF